MHILFCVNNIKFGTKCFVKVEQFVLPFIIREEKQSYAQVAEELDISIKTVDAQLQKAVTRLKEMISSSG